MNKTKTAETILPEVNDAHETAYAPESSLAEDVPIYKPGISAAEFIQALHNADYVEFSAIPIAGRQFGCNGIGKLTEVGLVRPDEHVLVTNHPHLRQDPTFFLELFGLPGLPPPMDLALLQEQTDALVMAYEDNGVRVHWLEFPESPGGPYGPWMGHVYVAHANVYRGGSIIPKMGWLPGTIGVVEYVAKWAWNELNIPVLGTITEGVCETGATIWLAQDVIVTADSCAFTPRGVDQFVSLLTATSGTEEFHNLVLRPDTEVFFNPANGACSHTDMNLMAVDIGKVVVSPSLDPAARQWLVDNTFELIEADADEQKTFLGPCNVILLEPGLVSANTECANTNRKLEQAGVRVIEVPASEILKSGGGNRCRTMQIHREPGPTLAEIKAQ